MVTIKTQRIATIEARHPGSMTYPAIVEEKPGFFCQQLHK
jgi:hypothetical protein